MRNKKLILVIPLVILTLVVMLVYTVISGSEDRLSIRAKKQEFNDKNTEQLDPTIRESNILGVSSENDTLSEQEILQKWSEYITKRSEAMYQKIEKDTELFVLQDNDTAGN